MFKKNFTWCERREISNGFRFKELAACCVAGPSAESWGLKIQMPLPFQFP